MKFLNTLVLFVTLLFTTIASADKCCETCTAKGYKKFYSVDKIFNRCGECCMKPNKYWLYHMFEAGLLEAETENPCKELGFTEYETTETHGVLAIKMTLDKYRKPN
ncbi:hypothetical protein BCR32DRAFT_326835 [Anaeromyces robustus]|uniref:Uncharacterized protein n=1 Tax=Anaeromyces robustus TaxID=1754192 RepID=A0A1Y1X9S1_9FUNG|nr:hypothetical protein BCR32DRAFT_326835 [Anaeromyces robustus]|eukprot:ORX82469.1 hypothetical protein BCR32DRAFT_326835 [Anaeromyces robustus]